MRKRIAKRGGPTEYCLRDRSPAIGGKQSVLTVNVTVKSNLRRESSRFFKRLQALDTIGVGIETYPSRSIDIDRKPNISPCFRESFLSASIADYRRPAADFGGRSLPNMLGTWRHYLTARAALSITRATARGREMCIRWLPLRTVTVEPARLAIRRAIAGSSSRSSAAMIT
jgi:hypothetical protein